MVCRGGMQTRAAPTGPWCRSGLGPRRVRRRQARALNVPLKTQFADARPVKILRRAPTGRALRSLLAVNQPVGLEPNKVNGGLRPRDKCVTASGGRVHCTAPCPAPALRA
jgi:hypothetical protein